MLNNSDFHIWIVDSKKITDTSLLDGYKKVLSSNEISRLNQILEPDSYKNYLVSRALLRTTLAKYVGVKPSKINFYKNLYGRPYLDHLTPESSSVFFNLSHTKGLVVLVVAREPRIGVDVEMINLDFNYMDIAFEYFSLEEVQLLRRTDGREQRKLFYALWTLKESFLKARGEGLSIELWKPSFRFDKGQIKCKFDVSLSENPKNWHFSVFKPTEGHLVSTSVFIPTQKPFNMLVKNIIPHVSEKIIEYPDFLAN